MTQEHPAPRAGATSPDPIDLAHASADLDDAVHRLAVVQRAVSAEQHRQQMDGTADRSAVLNAWRVNNDLMAEAVANTTANAQALRLLVRQVAATLA